MEEAIDDILRALEIAPDIRGLLPGFREFDVLLRHPRLRR
jgi:hypothetical protein